LGQVGNGGTGEIPSQLLHISGKVLLAEQQSRCPLEPKVGGDHICISS
jgi:hypothetical protein